MTEFGKYESLVEAVLAGAYPEQVLDEVSYGWGEPGKDHCPECFADWDKPHKVCPICREKIRRPE